MQFNKNAINRLLSMSDEQLAQLVRQIAGESGLDLSSLGIDAGNIQALRQALGSATEEDLLRYRAIYDQYRNQKQ
jgi:hypothetical protein